MLECECGYQADFKVLPIGLKPRAVYAEHRPNMWLCCGKCLVRILRSKAYSSYTVRMLD